jgi:uncharacterized protein
MNLFQSPLVFTITILAVVLTGLAKGGFTGMGALSTPILALIMDPISAAAMMLPILIIQDIVSVWSFRKTYDQTVLAWMLPGALLGIVIGWLFAASVNVHLVKAMLGIISLLFGIQRLAADRGYIVSVPMTLPPWVGSFWGAVSGFTSHIAHAGGPPFQVWTLGRGMNQVTYAGTAAIFFAVVNWMKVPAYLSLGQFNGDTLKLSAQLMPVALLSTFAGVALVKHVSPKQFSLAINSLMIGVGLLLMYQAMT